ncbi:hypothetical protein F8M41_007871 [Gigaspora margarita]|uniref:Apple domain-containing protein n=1 Tax=Gigaspora margarita TaxID=4874 RepID=A0A8H4A432_GIGMA|nr:hypothetical protein F8M41_007871 [Gigaspora margarita]
MKLSNFKFIFLSCLLTFSIFIDAHELENNKHENNYQHCCESPGESPGWKNSIHRLAYLNAAEKLDIPTPSGCCEACVENKYCVGWVFTEVCLHAVNRGLIPGVCEYPTLDGTPLQDTPVQNEPWQACGVIRCSDGCNLPLPKN